MARLAKFLAHSPLAWLAASLICAAVGLSCARAADAPVKSDKKDDKAAAAGDKQADDKKADDKKEESADEAARRVQLLGMRRDPDFAKEKAAFVQKYPDHPARWILRYYEVMSDFKGAGDKDGLKKVTEGLTEIANAKDAEPRLRQQSAMVMFQLALSDAKPEELGKLVSDHMAKFPETNGKQLASMVVGTVSRGSKEKAAEALEALAKSDNQDLADLATKKLDQIKVLLDLKTKPLDLKFTAVDDREVDLEKLHGKVVLIDFWATWCGPCVAGLPEVIALNEKYHDKGLEVIGISFDNNKEKLQKFVEEKKMPWPQYFDGKTWENVYGRKYGIDAIPCMWLIDKDGKVIDFEARQDLPAKIAKLLGE